MEMHKLAGKISAAAAAAARKFLLFLHFVCKYHLNAISELFLQLRREKRPPTRMGKMHNSASGRQANGPNSQAERIGQEVRLEKQHLASGAENR